MVESRPQAVIDRLRARIRAIEAGARASRGVLPFGVAALDAALPEGGLALGALHEVAAGGGTDGAAAALFAAGALSNQRGCSLFAEANSVCYAASRYQSANAAERFSLNKCRRDDGRG